MIVEYYNTLITQLIFVGDEEKDRKTAINAGCMFIQINRKERLSGDIYDLSELFEILEEKNTDFTNKIY